MGKVAFVFPGQGAQSVGMGKEFYDVHPVAKRLFDEADEALGYSIKDMCFSGPEEDLKLTANTQPAILVVSVIAYELVKERGIKADMAAGHSLGEYSALVAAGSIEFKDAVALVHKRGMYMQEAVPVGEGAMAAVLGFDRQKLIAICDEVSKISPKHSVQAVNFNCPGQIVIAGASAGVEKAVELLKEAGAKKSVILPVSAPFHSNLMKPAADKLAIELDKIDIKDASIPVIANVNAKQLTKASDIRNSLVEQAANPVLWEDCVAKMRELGADTILELGPGKTLSGFNRRIDKAIKSYNVEDSKSLDNMVSVFVGGDS